MPMFCIQCSMKALVSGETYQPTDETPEQHMQRCHPNPEEAQRERKELEKQIDAKFGKEAAP